MADDGTEEVVAAIEALGKKVEELTELTTLHGAPSDASRQVVTALSSLSKLLDARFKTLDDRLTAVIDRLDSIAVNTI